MIANNPCPCCSGSNYEACCAVFHNGVPAPTAEKLMRSRYAAYALCLPDYLIETTLPAKRKLYDKQDIIDWSTENKWYKLEIVKASSSIVEFKASYMDPNGDHYTHHELSTFSLLNGKWYYAKGVVY